MNNDMNNNHLFGAIMGEISMSLIEEQIAELRAAQISVQDILDKLPLIYQGKELQVRLPQRGSQIENIKRGVEAINRGCPYEIAEEYFQTGLAEMQRKEKEIRSFAPTLASDVACSFAYGRNGIIPTPACLSKFF